MADSYKCDKCGEEFDSERGLHIHEGQVHEDEIEESETDETENTTETVETEDIDFDDTVEPSGSGTLQVPMRLAFLTVFVLGVAVGLSSGLLAAGSDLGVPGAQSLTGPAPAGNGTADGGGDGGGSPRGVTTGVSVSDLSNGDDPVLGQEDAPVTMVMYEDFQCPFCKRFEENTFPKIESNFVESGDLKIVWKDYPIPQLGHDWAEAAAYAMECVYREGGNEPFWNVKEKVFANQDSLTTSTVTSEIKSWASQEGVSESAVQSCIDSGVDSEIQEDKQEGANKGVSGTPSFLIYSSNSDSATRVVGAQPYSRFVDVINSKLE